MSCARKPFHRFAPLVLLLLLCSGCFVRGVDESDVVSVRLALGGTAKGGAVPPGETVRLGTQPCYVGVQISAPDLASPVSAAWACDPGETADFIEDLELEVTAGEDRELRAVAFLNEDGRLVTFIGYQVTTLDPGAHTLELTLEEQAVGAIDGFASGTDSDIDQVILTDLATGVELPPLPATATGGGFHFAADWVPRGRFFGLTLVLTDGDTVKIPDCPVYVTEGSVRVLDVDGADGSC
ncbi:MAG: hypothetical protein ABI333_10295 [bacterium]